MPPSGRRGIPVIAVVVSIYMWFVGMIGVGLALIFGVLMSYIFPARIWDPWFKGLMRLWFHALFIRVETEGADRIRRDRTYVFMSNHVSLFDVPLLAGYIPVFVRGVEADRQFKWPVYGWAVKRFGNIPINRDSVHASISSIRKAVRKLKEGISIVIMPEGHRTLDGKMRPFKKLPFFLVKEAGCDLAPIGISGLFHLKAKESWIIRPTRIKIKFGDPISSEIIRGMSEQKVMEQTRKSIQSLIERP
jgi:1-acyl-sn-glycerol-3-phosphate acyltransferase